MIRSILGKVTAKGNCIGFSCANMGPFGKNLVAKKVNRQGTIVYVNGVPMEVASIDTEIIRAPGGYDYVLVSLETPNDVGRRHKTARSPQVQKCITAGRKIHRELQYAGEQYRDAIAKREYARAKEILG